MLFRCRTWLILSFVLCLPQLSMGQDIVSVSLQLSPDYSSRVCPSPLWQGQKLVWMGVSDRRSSKEVGLQTKKKGNDPVHIVAEPPLEKILDSNLRELLTRCGLQPVSTASEAELSLQVFVEEFYVGVRKGVLTGKGEAKSRLVFVFKTPFKTKNVVVSYEMEFKDLRKKKIQQMTATLNELLGKTLEQIPKTPALVAIEKF